MQRIIFSPSISRTGAPMAALFLLLTILSLHYAVSISAPTFSVSDFGAAGDGLRYDTKEIQAAIDACTAAGGGRVRFAAGGDFLTGTVFLRSGVVLEVERGARIVGGRRQEDYLPESARWYVVLAENATAVGITGGGEINGQSEAFVVRPDPRKNVMVSWNRTGDCVGDECRPRLVGFIDSKEVRVWDITLNQPAYWCLHLVRCNDIKIHDIAIYGDFNTPNNDGIDIDDSNNTIITQCHIDTGDDAICPKSSAGPVHNLTVTNCWIRTKSSAVKLGSASWFDFRNFLFNNITIFDSHRGLAMQIRDGGNVSDIIFSNIKISTRYYDPLWWGRAEPIYITTCPRDSTSKSGFISDILFENITVVSENGVFLTGSREGILSNITFKNVNLTYRRWTKYPGGLYDYRPGCQDLINHSTSGMMMEYIDGLLLENVNMKWFKSKVKEWIFPLEFKGYTVNKLSFHDWNSEVINPSVGFI